MNSVFAIRDKKPGYTSGRIENGGGVGEFREN